MEIHFKDAKLIDLFALPLNELGKQPFSKEVIIQYRKKIDAIHYADDISDLKKNKGLNFEKLKGKIYKDCYSIRVNKQYRIIFKEIKDIGIVILILELSKHYE